MVVENALGDRKGYVVWVKLKRVVVAVGNEGGADKAWADVMEVDVVDVSNVAELSEAFNVMADVAFCGGIGWGGSKSAGGSNAADDGQMSFVVRVLLKVVESSANHLGESHHICGDCCHFLLHVEGWVLITDAGTMEVEVHAACLVDEGEEALWGILLGYVNTFSGNHIKVVALNLLQQGLPTSGNAYLPVSGGEYFDHFVPDA